MTDNPALRSIAIAGVGRTFDGGVRALEGVSLDIPAGSFTVLVGPSGCGKTTLLRIIGGLDAPTEGSVTLLSETGQQVTPERAGVSFAFQEPRLLPWRNVRRNIQLPLELAGIRNPERMDRAMDMAMQVGLSDAINRYPGQLSGGMKMRAAIARALVTEPDLLLLDEPFGALDEITRSALDEMLRELWKRTGTTIVLVTHSIAEAVSMGQRVVVMGRNPGRIEQCIEISFAEHGPDLRLTAGFAAVMSTVHQALVRGMAVRP